MQKLAGSDFELALDCLDTLTGLYGCRAGDRADQRFGSQLFSGAARRCHGEGSIENVRRV